MVNSKGLTIFYAQKFNIKTIPKLRNLSVVLSTHLCQKIKLKLCVFRLLLSKKDKGVVLTLVYPLKTNKT